MLQELQQSLKPDSSQRKTSCYSAGQPDPAKDKGVSYNHVRDSRLRCYMKLDIPVQNDATCVGRVSKLELRDKTASPGDTLEKLHNMGGSQQDRDICCGLRSKLQSRKNKYAHIAGRYEQNRNMSCDRTCRLQEEESSCHVDDSASKRLTGSERIKYRIRKTVQLLKLREVRPLHSKQKAKLKWLMDQENSTVEGMKVACWFGRNIYVLASHINTYQC